jgi:hypothetical protein
MHALTKLLRLLQSNLDACSMARTCSMNSFEASYIATRWARPSQKIGFFLLICRQGQESLHLNAEYVLCPFSRLKDSPFFLCSVQLYGIPFVLKIDLFEFAADRLIEIRKVRICVLRDAHGQCRHCRRRCIDRLEISRRRAWPVRVSRPLTCRHGSRGLCAAHGLK